MFDTGSKTTGSEIKLIDLTHYTICFRTSLARAVSGLLTSMTFKILKDESSCEQEEIYVAFTTKSQKMLWVSVTLCWEKSAQAHPDSREVVPCVDGHAGEYATVLYTPSITDTYWSFREELPEMLKILQ